MTQRKALAFGLGVVALYAMLAAWSSAMSPLARFPILDAGGGLARYHWVTPPPELAQGNQQPSPGSFDLSLGPRGNEVNTFVTADGQVTVLVSAATFPPHGHDTDVRLEVLPRDPAELPAPAGDFAAIGNLYEVRASYAPSGTPATGFDRPMAVILFYPVTVDLLGSNYELQFSPDGKRWVRLRSNGSLAQQTVGAKVNGPGYVVVAAKLIPSTVSPSPPGNAGGESDTVAIVLLVAAGASLLVGLALIVRGGSEKRRR